MCEKLFTRRHIVLVDDVADASTTPTLQNPSSISRLHAAIRTGPFVDAQRRTVDQDTEYYQAVAPGSAITTKFGVNTVEPHEQQIRNIVLKICENVKDSADEIFLFGSGHGAYTVRAVAGILHHMGIPQAEHKQAFPVIYNATLNLIKSRGIDDSRKLNNVSPSLCAGSCESANIQFVGLFDALQRPAADVEAYDTRILPTVRNFRHALAFNENQASKTLDMPEAPEPKHLVGRSFVQAWFLGSHSDIVGGTRHDGLSIYPLQWMMIEAMLAGLVLSFEETVQDCLQDEDPLALVFPKHAGHAPNLSADGEYYWHVRYRNGIEVRMADLQSVHVANQETEQLSHSIHLETPSFMHRAPRRIFSNSKRGLSGYEVEHPSGTVIHPSVFCILHRNQRFLEQSHFRYHREDLASFEADCLQTDPASMPPWHHESELLASGVKAFRILVCGKTGVGKSTLINKIFGVEIVCLLLIARDCSG